MSAALRCIPGGDPSPAGEWYARVPIGPIRLRSLSDRAKVVLTGCCFMSWGSLTWVEATIESIAVEAGMSVRKVRDGLRELTSAGLLEWESIGHRFRILLRLRGQEEGLTAPAPRIAPAPPTDKPVTIRDPKREPVSVPDPSPEPPPTPLLVRKEEKSDPVRPRETTDSSDLDPVTDAEILAELGRQASGVFTHGVSAAELAGYVGRHGAENIEAAMEKARPHRPRGIRYLDPILEEWERQGIDHSPEGQDPRKWMQNYNPAPPPEAPVPLSAAELAQAINQVRGDDPIAARMARAGLLNMIAAGRLDAGDVPAEVLADPRPMRKKSAAGPTWQVSPRPIGGPSPRPVNCIVNQCSRSSEGAAKSGQETPRASNPPAPAAKPGPPPSGGASLARRPVTPDTPRAHRGPPAAAGRAETALPAPSAVDSDAAPRPGQRQPAGPPEVRRRC